MSNRIEINLTGTTFTDEVHYDCGATAFKLSELDGYPDPIENLGHDWFDKENLVIRTASGGGGTLLAEGAGNDYLLSEESTDVGDIYGLSTRVTAAVGSTRTIYSKIQIINATYQTGALYFSGKYYADDNSAEDYNWLLNRPQETNDIINGSMELNQRSTPGATYTAPSTGDYTIDRFENQFSGGTLVFDVIHDTDTPDDEVNYSYKFDVTTAEAAIAAAEYCIISHKIEGYNYQKYIANSGTLSFWVKAVKTGTYCVAFRNSGTDRTYIVEYKIQAASTWERKVITVDFDYSGGTWDTTSGIGLEIDFVIFAGTDHHGTADTWLSTADFATSNQVNGADSTDNNFWLAKVKFEPGSRATKFWSPNIERQIALCQRYYEKTYNHDDGLGTATSEGAVYYLETDVNNSTYTSRLSWIYKTRKRDEPTVVTYDLAGTINKVSLASGVFASTVSEVGETSARVSGTDTVAGTIRTIGYQATADAEL